ncbi:MAG: hypothetical protein LKK54_02750 [Ancrocorticia sp.]|jgi:hypothetical protein|nr:hypothetical protein [Ancrocorticia sp.]MCI1932648.1 hypothetical protein [Ancrocorticia sp.]MCI2178986.1 hypothetical protein [Ancrocorticia sp.]MCI2194087.1 hypothetical protein [Ancrocorticia sp.]MCI2198644.1 hypothetical protein [Ancrocorticia sp.]
MRLTTIAWVGESDALERRLLEAGGGGRVQVVVLPSFDEVARCRGLSAAVVPLNEGVPALQRAYLADGLAKAVGCADTLAYTEALPEAFGFLATVGALVAAVRETVGSEYMEGSARIAARGPGAWSALAALTQLRCAPIDGGADPMLGAIAHRLGVTLAPVRDPLVTVATAEHGIPEVQGKFTVQADVVRLHTVAAQLRLACAREPDIGAMRAAIGCG